jgi:hypothetical protein
VRQWLGSPRRWLLAIVLAVLLLAAGGVALGVKTVWIFDDRPCPLASTAQPVGVMDGAWRCVPTGVTAPAGDAIWWNSLPTAYRRHEVGLYLANVRVRVFSYEDPGPGFHYVGLNVPAPE